MKRGLILSLSLVTLLSGMASLAQADGRHGRQGRHGWDGRIEHFERHDMGRWRGGYWHHGRHGGDLGWWWVVAGIWYFYPEPIYPYPDPYRPPVVVYTPPVEAPPVVTAPPVPQVWYYCEAAGAYYPYVPSCPTGWKAVPAVPPQP